jgi:defect-in-organelle-trafficking protein DotD
MQFHSFTPLAFAVWVLVACETTSSYTSESTEAFADRVIAEKVGEAAQAQSQYSALLAEDQQARLRKQASIKTDVIDVDYIGKPAEFLSMMALRYGLRFIEAGKRVDLRTINIHTKNVPPLEVLRDVGIQIDKGADLEVDVDNGTLRVIYKAPR